ncbi:hypothetical protein VSR69_40700 [Paraburkholderia phytofirmans]
MRGKNSGNQLTDKNLNAEAAQDVKDNASKSGLCRPSLTFAATDGERRRAVPGTPQPLTWFPLPNAVSTFSPLLNSQWVDWRVKYGRQPGEANT